MDNLATTLKTISIVAGLALFALCLIVYFLAKIASILSDLERAVRKLQVPAPVVAAPEKKVEEKPAETAPVVALEPKQYHCWRCHAKLPLEPTHSIVEDEIAFLVFKCRRCGKETKVDPLSENR